MKNNNPKRHHYLPISYLERFTNADGILWIYDRFKDEYRTQQPIDTGVIKHYYTFADADGKPNVDLETKILQNIDGKAKSILDKIDSGDVQISADEKTDLADYLGYFFVRGTPFEKHFKNEGEKVIKRLYANDLKDMESMERYLEKILGFPKPLQNFSDSAKLKLLELIQSEKFKSQSGPTQKMRIDSIQYTAPRITNLLLQMKWHFCRNFSGDPYLTTDNPFIYYAPKGEFTPLHVGLRSIATLKHISLSPVSSLLIFGIGGIELLFHDRSDVYNCNRNLAYGCDRFLISSDKMVLIELVKDAKANFWNRIKH